MMRDPNITSALPDPKGNATTKMTIFVLLIGAALILSSSSSQHLRQFPILALGAFAIYFCLYLALAYNKLRDKYHQQIDLLKQSDGLTGLATRQLFLSTLYERLKSANFQNKSFALLLIDIDRFKELDTILGTENGDLLLQEFAQRLQHFQKQKSLVARLSGNEFAIILEDRGSSSTLEQHIQILHSYLKQSYRFHGRPIDITVSGGYVLFPQHGYRSGSLLQQAKMALLRAKQEGRDQICVFEQRQDVRAHMDHELSQEMGKSIAQGEFLLHFQPQFCTETGRQTGFEALMRWDHPVRGWVSPGTFIHIAERNGMILPLSEFALREACRRAASWKQPLRVAVNLSPIQFKKTDLVLTVQNILKETGLAPNRLELEVTESLFIHTSQRTIDTLRELREMGITIALDDFGTGYSSLSYLSAFPIDKIKIDRSFVSELAQNSGNMAIISAMIGIGKSLDIAVLAEGIEDKETLEMLRVAGCQEAQGFLLGRPRDIEAEPGFEMTSPEPLIEPAQLKLIQNRNLCA